MKQEIIKQAFKLGNSSGILLPKEWNGRKVAVRLIEKSIQQEILDILSEEDLLKNVIGIFLAGSYARDEETETSDIDILVITDSINKQIKKGKYDLFIISKEKFEKTFMKSIYLASLINEAKVILNSDFLNNHKNKIWNISLKKTLEEIESITKINEKFVMLNFELSKKVGDETIYSLVLRLRELYLIDCLRKKQAPSSREFLNLLKKIASEDSYNAYLRVKNDLKTKEAIPVEEALSLIKEIKKRVNNLKHGKTK